MAPLGSSGAPLGSQDRSFSSSGNRLVHSKSDCGPLMACLSAQLSDVHVQVPCKAENSNLPRPHGSFKGDGCKENAVSEDQLSDLQNRLEVSYQWALDLETELHDTKTREQESTYRCEMLESALRDKDRDLESASPRLLTLCRTPVACAGRFMCN
jgi:hypothetical protein